MRCRADTGMSEDHLILVGADVVEQFPDRVGWKIRLATMVIGMSVTSPIGAKAVAVS